MAKIKTAPHIDRVSGRIGGSVFSLWKDTGYVRGTRRTFPRPKGEHRGRSKTIFQVAVLSWKNTLTDAQRAAWEQWAALVAKRGCGREDDDSGTKDVKPEGKRTMSGANQHIRVAGNGNNTNSAGPIKHFDDPPTRQAPNPPTALTCECFFKEPHGNMIRLLWTDPTDVIGTPPDNGAIRPWYQSQDARIAASYATHVPIGFQHYDLIIRFTASQVKYPISTKPGHYRFQVDYVDNQGQCSTGSNVVECEIPIEPCPPWTPFE